MPSRRVLPGHRHPAPEGGQGMSEDESPLKVFDRYVHSIAKTDDRAAPFSHEPRKAIIAMIDEMATLKEKERARSQIIDSQQREIADLKLKLTEVERAAVNTYREYQRLKA